MSADREVPGPGIRIRHLGLAPYVPVFEAMKAFTAARDASTGDELWLVQHSPVFTQGLAGKPEHVLAPGDIPIVQVDRGGQVTYHGPGQIVLYCLLDMKRAGLGVRDLVSALERSVVELLAELGIEGYPRPDAPGVYVAGAKIASLGLRVRRWRSYHGLALNVDMDLEPFRRINPCGYRGLAMTQLRDLGVDLAVESLEQALVRAAARNLGYATLRRVTGLPTPAEQEQPHVRAQSL